MFVFLFRPLVFFWSGGGGDWAPFSGVTVRMTTLPRRWRRFRKGVPDTVRLARWREVWRVTVKLPRYRGVGAFPRGWRVTVKLPRFREVGPLPWGYRVSVRLARCRNVGALP